MKPTRQKRSGAPLNSPPKTATPARNAVLAPAPAAKARINPKWTWHYRALLTLRDRLRHERGEQLKEAAQPLEAHSMDIADTATDEFDHDLALARLSAEQNALYEVEEALRRVRDGTYGVCQETGKGISAARLRAVPWTRFCRDTQAELERTGAVKPEHLGVPASIRASTVEGFEEAESEGQTKDQPEPEDEALWNRRVPRSPSANRSKQPPPKHDGKRR